MATDWDDRLAQWSQELELLRALDDTAWVTLGVAVAETGVARSTLRSWYRDGSLPSRLVDSPNGPQRLVPLDAVVTRATRSARIQRRTEREVGLEAQVALLAHRLSELEQRLAALEAPQSGGSPT